MTAPTFHAFVTQRAGGSWVLARRSPRILERYGADVVCLSKARYKALTREYRELYGDPHDPDRAELYRAAKDFLALCDGGIGPADSVVVTHRLRKALAHEATL